MKDDHNELPDTIHDFAPWRWSLEDWSSFSIVPLWFAMLIGVLLWFRSL